ncbi:MAG: hypothetical protein OEN01_07200 [Candidatus Krumholzibacteria bacterium]|nr:hypothetical protein [Candidatus Krumholzibacteria bacterium]
MKRRLLAVTCLLLFCVDVPTVRAGAYGTELPFVIGTSTRSSALGIAGATVHGDASVQYYNPSGMSYLNWKELVLFRTVLFDSKSLYHAASFAYPVLNRGTVGLTLMRLDVSGIEQRDSDNQLLSSDLKNSQTRLLIGYGIRVGSFLSVGANIKVDNQSFAGLSASGVGLDLGITGSRDLPPRSPIRTLRAGLVFHNVVEPAIKLDREKVPDPLQVTLGLAMLAMIGDVALTTSLDMVSPRYSPFSVRFGQEATYRHRYALRFGVDEAAPTYGFGTRYRKVTLDYAFRKDDLGNNHRIAMAVRFGASVDERRIKARMALEEHVNREINNRLVDLERSQIADAVSEGDRLFAAGDLDGAWKLYEMALLWDPDNEHADVQIARCNYGLSLANAESSMQNGDFVQAILHAKKALEFFADDERARTIIRQCNEAIARAQDNSQFAGKLLRTSIDLYANRQFKEALSGFDEVLRIDPTNELARDYRDKCRTNIDRTFQRLVRNSRTRAARGDYVRARQSLEDALRIKRDPAVEAELKELRERKEVRREVTRKSPPKPQPTVARRISPTNTVLLERKYQQGMEAFGRGDFEEAVSAFQSVWAADPTFHNISALLSKAYLFMGMRHYAKEQYAEALDIWTKLLRIDPNNAKAKRYLEETQKEFDKLREVTDE